MSLYNMLFGSNPLSTVLLGTLGLTKQDVGRFRDCFISDGKIAVYTRNGGGNRECFCKYDSKLGSINCRHHVVQEIVDETIFVPLDEVDNYPIKWNIYMGSKRQVGTGKKVPRDYYVCEKPSSIECGCFGCVITYRLPEHPRYLYDEDDDFDCTYATIYFSFPEEYRAGLEALDSGEKFDPDQRWKDMIDRIGGKENEL